MTDHAAEILCDQRGRDIVRQVADLARELQTLTTPANATAHVMALLVDLLAAHLRQQDDGTPDHTKLVEAALRRVVEGVTR